MSSTNDGTVNDSQKPMTSHRCTQRIVPRRSLTVADWSLLARVAAMQIATTVIVRIVPLRVVRTVAARFARVMRVGAPLEDAKVVWAIEATGRRIGRLNTCLVQAVVAEAMLSSSVRSIRFTIGVKRVADGSLRAHAWVASENGVLIGATSEDYVHLVELSGTSA
jgi:Transglutaminase-like superfamily